MKVSFEEVVLAILAVWFVVAMFGAAFNSKALGATIAFCIGLLAVYPDSTKAGLLTVFYIAAVVASQFRD